MDARWNEECVCGNEATYGSDKSEWTGVTNLFSHDFLVLGPILYAALFVPKWS